MPPVENLWPLFIYALGVAVLVTAMLGLSAILGERNTNKRTNMTFESGIKPTGEARLRFSNQFYLIAVFFVIFDLEVVFIFAWAIANPEAGWLGFIEISIFVFVLLAAFVYLWREGALDITEKHDKKVVREVTK